LTLDEFRQKFLKPAIKALAQRIPSSAKFLSLEIPENFKDALIVEREGCSLRLVSDETMILPEIDDFGNGKGLGHAALVMRFDVLFEQQ
jgi:hypothetical protein